ncbi:hypothetical protein [Streptomyces sp. CT34]|uniref:hypothetical protein n=1 Tax=Streptomyces sp. CT34 TaxID=1553907 RepID=UPI0012FF5A71|nr:hypothetical protein [Streptomyces sp. CT34]
MDGGGRPGATEDRNHLDSAWHHGWETWRSSPGATEGRNTPGEAIMTQARYGGGRPPRATEDRNSRTGGTSINLLDVAVAPWGD